MIVKIPLQSPFSNNSHRLVFVSDHPMEDDLVDSRIQATYPGAIRCWIPSEWRKYNELPERSTLRKVWVLLSEDDTELFQELIHDLQSAYDSMLRIPGFESHKPITIDGKKRYSGAVKRITPSDPELFYVSGSGASRKVVKGKASDIALLKPLPLVCECKGAPWIKAEDSKLIQPWLACLSEPELPELPDAEPELPELPELPAEQSHQQGKGKGKGK